MVCDFFGALKAQVDFLLVIQAEGFWPPEVVVYMLKKVAGVSLGLQYETQKAVAASA